jgi:hypothetical protein
MIVDADSFPCSRNLHQPGAIDLPEALDAGKLAVRDLGDNALVTIT